MTRGSVSPRRRPLVAMAVAGLMGVVLAACGVANDESPRDIAPVDQRELGGNPDLGGGIATGTARIYLLGPASAAQTTTLQPVARNVAEQPTPVMQALMSGPNTAELGRQFHTALPSGTRLLSTRLQAGVLRVDVSKELLQVSGDDLVDALAQIVFTASQLDAVRSVKLTVVGEEQLWPSGSGELQSAPLTVYDYPGRVASAQPAYPAIPTPSQP